MRKTRWEIIVYYAKHLLCFQVYIMGPCIKVIAIEVKNTTQV